MSFWNLSDGGDATKTSGAFEVGGGNLEPIPDETTAIAIIDEAKWDRSREGDEFVSLRWSVVAPDDYKNRKIYQKLWVRDLDPRAKDAIKKRDKAIQMLAAIDSNAGGKLGMSTAMPNDDALSMALLNRPMAIKVKQWKMKNESTGEDMIGNWVAAVGPRPGSAAAAAARKPAPAAPQEEAPF